MNDLTVSEWARSIGISRQAGYNAVRRCSIPVTDGKVDPEVATALYRRRTRTRMNPNAGAGPAGVARHAEPEQLGHVSYEEARRRQAVADAKRAELDLLARAGELVRVTEVRAAYAGRLIALRESLLHLPDRLAAVLAAELTAGRCHEVLHAELQAVLAQAAES